MSSSRSISIAVNNTPNARRQSGFTLVELMTTLAVIGISVGIGAPNLQSFMEDNQQINAINEFSSYVSFARNEAVVRNTSVTLCIANADQTGCAEDTDNWANGYLVIAGDEVLKIHDKLPGKQTITGTNDSLTFFSNGMLSRSGSFNFCNDDNAEASRQVSINLGSQIRHNGNGSCTG